jgi:hypothetical protein
MLEKYPCQIPEFFQGQQLHRVQAVKHLPALVIKLADALPFLREVSCQFLQKLLIILMNFQL